MFIFNDKKVLIYDESKFMGRLLHTVLTTFGIGYLTVCHTLEEAKYHIKEIKYDCIFCDWSGWPTPELECLQYTRFSGSANDPSTPVIVCTGQTTLRQILDCRDSGCTEILAKPISPTHVFDKLYSALYKPREFVAIDAYTGPDRSRFKNVFSGIERRCDQMLAQDEIDLILAGENFAFT